MHYYLIGSRGRLGQAIAGAYDTNQLHPLSRNEYGEWSQHGGADKISRYFDKNPNKGSTLFVTSGLLDPSLSKDELHAINYLLPVNLIDGASKAGIKVVTFGTVMEGLVKSQNPYINSKIALKEFVENTAAKKNGVKPLHIQIHTLYGSGQPSSFMFLGQILDSIKNNKPFKMTSGRQLREYHHLSDETIAIKKLVEANFSGVHDISHGKPVSLASIAKSAFDAFGRADLLQIGALADPAEDNYEKILKPLNIVETVNFRESLPGIVNYLLECKRTIKT